VRVEPVEDVHPVLQLAQLHVAQRRLQRPPDVAGGGGRGAQLVVHDLHPAVEQHRDRGVLVRPTVGLDVGDQALGVELGVPAMAAGLAAEVDPLAGQGVKAGRDASAESGAQRLDRPP
jgi:hypothetical protein